MNPLVIIEWISKLGGALTGINFPAVFSAFGMIRDSIIKYWYLWLIGLLFASNAFTGYELKHSKDLLTSEKVAHAKDIADFKNAQELANTKSALIQATLVKESKDDAIKADANYSNLLIQYRSSLLRYQANQSAAQQSGNHQLPTPEGGDGPGAGADLSTWLRITQEDAGICAVNTARLQAVHDWAVGLPKEVPK